MISVGIDIGSFSIKVVEIDATVRPFQVTQFKEFQLSLDPNKDRKIEVIDILRKLAALYDGIPVHYTFSVPDWKTSIRKKIFPFKERHKILKSLPFELEDDIPFSPEDSVFEAKISRYLGPLTEVLAVACPVDYVAEKVQLAKDMGIDLGILSVDGLALSNIESNWWEPPLQIETPPEDPTDEDDDSEASRGPVKPMEVHLHIGHSGTVILFYVESILTAVRNIDWGGIELAEGLSKKYQMHFVEASKEIQKKAFLLTDNEGASKDQIVFSETLKESLSPMIHSLKLKIVEVEAEFNTRLEQGKFSGGVAQLKNLGPHLTQCFEIPFNRFNLSKNLPSINVDQNLQFETISPVAVALAIEGIKKPRNPAINLLKGEFSQQSQGFKPVWDKWGHAIQVGIAAFIFMMIWSSFRSDQARFMADEAHQEMKKLGTSVANLGRSRSGSISAIEKFLREQDKIEKSRQSAEKVNRMISAMDVLEKISSALPKTPNSPIDVKSVKIEKNTVTVQGEVDNRNAIQTVKNALASLAKGKKISNANASFQVTPGRQKFGFRFSIDRFEGGQ